MDDIKILGNEPIFFFVLKKFIDFTFLVKFLLYIIYIASTCFTSGI